MSRAICDSSAFYPLRNLVQGPFDDFKELSKIERLLRSVVLHDEILLEFEPNPSDPETEAEHIEQIRQHGPINIIVAYGPNLKGYSFF